MYTNSAAAPRADISAFLEEAVDVEKNFIGQIVLPIYPSAVENGRYPKFKIADGNLLRRETTKRGATGTYNEVTRKFDWEEYTTEDRGLEERIDDVVAKRFANFFDAEVLTSKFVMRALMLDYEAEVAAAVMNPAAFTTTNGSVVYSEANLTTIDFALDIQAAQERLTYLGEGANVMIMSLTVFNRLRRSLKMQLYLFGSLSSNAGNRLISQQMIADAFGVDQVIVTRTSYNMSAKGRPANVGPIWGNDYIFIGAIASGDFMNGGIGRTVIWEADSPNGLFATETYRAEPRRGNMVRVRSNRTQLIINPNAGQLLATRWV